jgi:phosphoglucosamine mutase
MAIFFGVDGLRGKINDDLSREISYKCGNALGGKYPNSKILVGKDTRGTGDFVALSFATGAMNAGAHVVDVGVCPTAGISYLTTLLGFDFGVVISASHNPAEYNGIKIFDRFGRKLGNKIEEELEKLFLKEFVVPFDKVGSYENNPRLVIQYEKFLADSIKTSLKTKTIVLDCANGSTFKLAPAVFRDNKAKIIATFCKPDGVNINKGCGALNISRLQRYVLKYKADMGFAFDGDGDRLIAVDELGNVIDGDKLLYLLACDYHENGKLEKLQVVGTRHTNMGVENAFKAKGIELVRADIGDRYVFAKMLENKLLIGGEQSGHIILADRLPTGDGILNALQVASICVEQNKKLSEFFGFEMYKQKNINVEVYDKIRIVNSARLSEFIDSEEKMLNGNGRIMIHVSGTEPCIRVMVETKDENLSTEVAERIANKIKEINLENLKCAE